MALKLRKPIQLAAIDAGSNAFRLMIARIRSTDDWEIVESVRAPVRLGHSVFTTGMLDRKTLRDATAAFREFRNIMTARGVTAYRAVTTSAAREAARVAAAQEVAREAARVAAVEEAAREAARVAAEEAAWEAARVAAAEEAAGPVDDLDGFLGLPPAREIGDLGAVDPRVAGLDPGLGAPLELERGHGRS